MLTITIPEVELFDNNKNEFLGKIPETTLQLEHSLSAIRKWETKWHIPFLSQNDKTEEQIEDYIRCMTLNEIPDDRLYHFIPASKAVEIIKYMDDPMTASWVNSQSKPGRPRTVTAELIYYWMIALGIPIEFQHWHIRQLVMLIQVVNVEQNPPKPLSPKEAAAERRRINEERKAKYHTTG